MQNIDFEESLFQKLHAATEGRIKIDNFSEKWHSFYTTLIEISSKAGPSSFYCGKGISLSTSLTGAFMEAIERLSASCYTGETIWENYCATGKNKLSLNSFNYPSYQNENHLVKTEWIEAANVVRSEKKYVPLNCVVFPYRPKPNEVALFYSHTTGLASGQSLENALLNGICEVAERHALSLMMTDRWLRDRVMDTKRRMFGIEKYDYALVNKKIEQDSLPKQILDLMNDFKLKGWKINFFSLSHITGIPTFECYLFSNNQVYKGSATDCNSTKAILKSYTEAAQAYLLSTSKRENLKNKIRGTAYNSNDYQYDNIDFKKIKSISTSDTRESIKLVAKLLFDVGLSEILYVDLTSKIFEIPCVRVIIPNAETLCTFEINDSNCKIGKAGLHLLEK